MTRTHLLIILSLCAACGDDPCPSGEMRIGSACVPVGVDGGPLPDASADEICNGVDDDQDGQVDEADPEIGAACSEDVGACTAGTLACVDGTLVCDGVLPSDEICNTIDDDCDGEVDELVQFTFYLDEDGDTFGGDTMCEACTVAECGEGNWVAFGGDCDDTCETCFEGGTEVCDGLNNDCDLNTDEGVLINVYVDMDNDGFGTGDAVRRCEVPVGFSDMRGDCADGDARAFPDTEEYYETPIMGDGPLLEFDFDCDGMETPKHRSCDPNPTCLNNACYEGGADTCGAANETQPTGTIMIMGMPERCVTLSNPPPTPSRTACH